MNIKLIALDMDGTVLKNDHASISQYTLNTLQKAIDQGVEIVPATGRVLSNLPQAFHQLHGINFALTSNGASVVNLHTHKTVYRDTIPEQPSRQLLQLLSRYQAVPEVYYDGKLLLEKSHVEKLRDSKEILNHVVLKHLVPIDHLETWMNGKRIEKINLVCIDPSCREAIIEGLSAIEGISFLLFDKSIEINSTTATKGNALIHLCQLLEISPENTMAIGDSDNDISMLQAAKWSFAMDNASPSAKQVACFETSSNEQDGVAHAIEKYVLNK